MLAQWLTSNPQHFNSRNAIAVRCLPDPLSPVLPWASVPEGVYDPADHLVVRKAIPSTPHTAFQEIMNAMRRASQKHLAKPRKTIRERFPAAFSPA